MANPREAGAHDHRRAPAGGCGHIGIKPNLVTDSGVENVNGDVDALIDADVITHILALVEVTYSNSIVEAYSRSLEHEWLFPNSLDNVRVLDKLVAFHVEQHNSVMPHSALRGQPPDEVYFGTGARAADDLRAAPTTARRDRLATNRAPSCPTCDQQSRVKSAVVQLRQPRS